METSVDKTLLAFLLALYRLEGELTMVEVADLQENVGRLLELRPDKEKAIIEEINTILEKNPALNQLYQEAMTKVASLEGEQLYQWLPQKNLLQQQLGITEIDRGYTPQGKPNQRTSEVVNLSRMVMTRDRPDKSVKQIQALAEYWELPQAPIF
ncbi:hypothetical protein J0895_18930 [Phormidium pseudopriestleyi FRX01]|uniref:Uncharacterized protein n=1 Tax=Phormidium pseudopriestleyi FRX01 TaxID=1759528 RepID=A0ABS3FVF6_9CYAN|nr:hypothetical protein [Phormidium pseudopriestleyi]MBO0351108.1 hypothetical protein [Phormidium pseudopriestleyi FRX01]